MSGFWQFPRADRKQFQRQAAIRDARRGQLRRDRSICQVPRIHGKHPPQHCGRSVLDFEPYRDGDPTRGYRVIIEPPGAGYFHVLTERDIRSRLSQLPSHLLQNLHTVLLPRMTVKRARMRCYGLQYGGSLYIYPSPTVYTPLVFRPRLKPLDKQWLQKFGAVVRREANHDVVTWTLAALRRFYLDHILIHELGHIVDTWNSSAKQRERFAEYFTDFWNRK